MNLISLIVPVFNAGNYFKQCIDLSQNYKDIELIIVNDGSTDNTTALCEQYMQQDNRVKVIYQQHSDEATSLNTGLAAAHGNEIMFISAVDFLGSDNNLSILHNLLVDNNTDVAISNFFEYHDDNGSTIIHRLGKFTKNYSPQQWFKYEYDHTNFMDQCFTSLYGKLFKKELLEDTDFTNEDNTTSDSNTWQIYLLANKITYLNDSLYVVRKNIKHCDSYRFYPEKLHSLHAIEERISILAMIDFNLKNELDQYVQRLKYHRDHALDHGNYYDYLNAVSKLDIINKHSSNQ